MFEMKELPKGNYRVNSITNARYNEIPSTYATIIAGKTIELSTIIT